MTETTQPPRKLRIAIDTTYMDGRRAFGTAILIRESVTALFPYRDEFDITLVHRGPVPDDPLYREFREVIIPHLPLPKYAGFFSELLFFLRTKERFDVYYFACPRLLPLFWLAPAKRIMFAAMDGGPQTAGFEEYGNPKVSPITRFFFGKVDRFVALSDFGRKGIAKAYRVPIEKVRTVYCGVHSRFVPAQDAHVAAQAVKERYALPLPYILDVSRFDPHKNILNTIRAYKRAIVDAGHPHALVFVGGRHLPGYSRQVDALIAELGLAERVIVAPFISDEDMPLLYAGATFFAFPSLYEGFGMPAVEAMACGTPVLVSDRGSLPEVVGNAGEIVDPYDVGSIARGMERILDPERARELSARGLERAKLFTWQKTAAGLATLFRELGARTLG